MKRDGAKASIWQHDMPAYTSAKNINKDDFIYDVVIVGGGITGLTVALELQKAGKNCLLAEANNIGFGTTGGTTAHINNMLDNSYDNIIKDFGEKNARLVLKSCNEAINLIKNNINEYHIECDFSEKKGYLFSQDEKQGRKLEEIFKASAEVGVQINYSGSLPVNIPFDKALLFEGQAQFNPIKYIYALAEAFEKAGGIIWQNCRIMEPDEEKEYIEIDSTVGKIKANCMVYATHIPPGTNILHLRCAPYRSYAIAIKLKNDNYPDSLVYDMYDPYHYYRTQEINGEKYLIAGGEDHKTAHEENTERCFRKLESYLKQHFEFDHVAFEWSSQFYEPTDGLPYIGKLPGASKNIYVATGFSGNGMTLGTLSGLIIKDLITGNKSEYEGLYSPSRIKPVAGFSNFIKEQADVIMEFITEKLSRKKLEKLAGLAHGEAKVVIYEGHSIAMFKDEKGEVHAVNPSCTHLKCSVAWNNSEQSWDCPCHGSRFGFDGEVLTGPARKDLKVIDLKTLFEE